MSNGPSPEARFLYWCIFAYDTLSVLVSGLFVYTLQYGVDNLYTNLNRVGLGIGLCMVLYMLAFFIFHTFNGVLRYSSFIDLRRVAYSSFTASIAICVFHQLQIRFGLSNYILVPRFVSGVQIFITATMLMWTARMAAKALHDLYNNFGISKNVFIYGAQSGAVALARSIVSDPSSRYKIKGFISDNEMMTSSRISASRSMRTLPNWWRPCASSTCRRCWSRRCRRNTSPTTPSLSTGSSPPRSRS